MAASEADCRPPRLTAVNPEAAGRIQGRLLRASEAVLRTPTTAGQKQRRFPEKNILLDFQGNAMEGGNGQRQPSLNPAVQPGEGGNGPGVRLHPQLEVVQRARGGRFPVHAQSDNTYSVAVRPQRAQTSPWWPTPMPAQRDRPGR